MIKDKIIMPKGWVKIWGIQRDGKKILLVDQNNGLVVNAKPFLAHALGGQPGFVLNTIWAYKAGSPLANCSPLTYTFPAANEITCNCTFSEASFNDTADEFVLGSATQGQFSI